MDQDAFRTLLATPRPKLAVPATTNSIPRKAASSAISEPGFKPRKVKKTESKYRNRAAERRDGLGNDYAQVEAVLEDFQKRVAHEDKDVIEEQRKYLGGDSQHTILVKGLDISLLEQNRMRATASTEDDEILEQAFAEAASTSTTTEPKKPTREDIIRELKAKRQNEDRPSDQPAVEKSVEDGSAFEIAKAAGKFRPIGFRPTGRTDEKPKKRKMKEGKESVKKKKRKAESTLEQSETKERLVEEMPSVCQEPGTTEASIPKMLKKPPEPEPDLLGENGDIFAGAGDYEGFPSDEEPDGEPQRDAAETGASQEVVPPGAKRWFDEPELEVRPATPPPEKPAPIPETKEEPLCLQPLESSALPSIRDFLAMDEAVEKAEKRKARKEKKKKKKGAGEDDD